MTIARLIERRQYEPDLNEAELVDFTQVAMSCARGVRGCATDDQYRELRDRIVEALAFASSKIRPVGTH